MLLPPMLAAAPAAEVAAAPVADDYARGRALRLSGQAAAAVPLLERAARDHPQDADIWLHLGLAQIAAGSLGAADEALVRAAALAPDYLDVQIARVRVAFYRGDLADARRRLAPLRDRAPDHPDVRAIAAQLERAAERPASWRLDAAYSHARLSKGLPEAGSATLALGRRLRSGLVVSGSVEQVRQFDRSDTFAELEVARAFGHLSLGVTPQADFRPEVAIRGGLATAPRPLRAGWTAQVGLDLGWAKYKPGEVWSVRPALTLAKGDLLTLEARWINVRDERRRYLSGYALHGDWRALSKLRLSAGWSSAPESEEGVTNRVRAATAGAALELNAATALHLGFAHEKRQAYDRDETTLGVSRRF